MKKVLSSLTPIEQMKESKEIVSKQSKLRSCFLHNDSEGMALNGNLIVLAYKAYSITQASEHMHIFL